MLKVVLGRKPALKPVAVLALMLLQGSDHHAGWAAAGLGTFGLLIMLFSRYERASGDAMEVPHWRLIVGLLLICAGLGATAAISIASPEGVTGVRLWLVALPFVGAAVAQFGPVHRLAT